MQPQASAVTGTCLCHPVTDTGLTVTLLENQAGLRLRGEADMLGMAPLRDSARRCG